MNPKVEVGTWWRGKSSGEVRVLAEAHPSQPVLRNLSGNVSRIPLGRLNPIDDSDKIKIGAKVAWLDRTIKVGEIVNYISISRTDPNDNRPAVIIKNDLGTMTFTDDWRKLHVIREAPAANPKITVGTWVRLKDDPSVYVVRKVDAAFRCLEVTSKTMRDCADTDILDLVDTSAELEPGKKVAWLAVSGTIETAVVKSIEPGGSVRIVSDRDGVTLTYTGEHRGLLVLKEPKAEPAPDSTYWMIKLGDQYRNAERLEWKSRNSGTRWTDRNHAKGLLVIMHQDYPDAKLVRVTTRKGTRVDVDALLQERNEAKRKLDEAIRERDLNKKHWEAALKRIDDLEDQMSRGPDPIVDVEGDAKAERERCATLVLEAVNSTKDGSLTSDEATALLNNIAQGFFAGKPPLKTEYMQKLGDELAAARHNENVNLEAFRASEIRSKMWMGKYKRIAKAVDSDFDESTHPANVVKSILNQARDVGKKLGELDDVIRERDAALTDAAQWKLEAQKLEASTELNALRSGWNQIFKMFEEDFKKWGGDNKLGFVIEAIETMRRERREAHEELDTMGAEKLDSFGKEWYISSRVRDVCVKASEAIDARNAARKERDEANAKVRDLEFKLSQKQNEYDVMCAMAADGQSKKVWDAENARDEANARVKELEAKLDSLRLDCTDGTGGVVIETFALVTRDGKHFVSREVHEKALKALQDTVENVLDQAAVDNVGVKTLPDRVRLLWERERRNCAVVEAARSITTAYGDSKIQAVMRAVANLDRATKPGTPEPEKDNCEQCHGESGGVPGNGNIVDGRILCDYCHAKSLRASPPTEAPDRVWCWPHAMMPNHSGWESGIGSWSTDRGRASSFATGQKSPKLFIDFEAHERERDQAVKQERENATERVKNGAAKALEAEGVKILQGPGFNAALVATVKAHADRAVRDALDRAVDSVRALIGTSMLIDWDRLFAAIRSAATPPKEKDGATVPVEHEAVTMAKAALDDDVSGEYQSATAEDLRAATAPVAPERVWCSISTTEPSYEFNDGWIWWDHDPRVTPVSQCWIDTEYIRRDVADEQKREEGYRSANGTLRRVFNIFNLSHESDANDDNFANDNNFVYLKKAIEDRIRDERRDAARKARDDTRAVLEDAPETIAQATIRQIWDRQQRLSSAFGEFETALGDMIREVHGDLPKE